MYKQKVSERIRQRRHQMIFHSIAYYKFGISFVTDEQFDKWAKELVRLQKKYAKISKKVIYFEQFKDWDGSTGFHLIDVDLPKFRSKIYHHARYLQRIKDPGFTVEMKKFIQLVNPTTNQRKTVMQELDTFLSWLEGEDL